MPLFDFPGVRRLLRRPPRGRDAVSREITEELGTHVALWAESLVARGLSPDDALREAQRRFGDYAIAQQSLIDAAQHRQGTHRMREWIDSLSADGRLAARQLRRARGFAAFNVLTIALAVGLTTAVFATIDTILLRPLPFPKPEQLVQLQGQDSVSNPVIVVSADNWFDWKQQNRTLSSVAIHTENRLSVDIGGEGVGIRAQVVSPEFFSVLRPRFLFGRGFDGMANADGTGVVVSEQFWRSSLGGRTGPDLTVSMFGTPREVIGVLAEGQSYPAGTDLWTPYIHRQVGGGARNNVNWYAVGRLRDGVTAAAAERDLGAIARRIHEQEPVALYSYGVPVQSLQDALVGDTSNYLRLLMGAALMVLLIGVANLSSANLARGVQRAGEMAVRTALGANRARVVRQLLIEHLVIALTGGLIGTLVAALVVRVVSTSPLDIPRLNEVTVDTRVLLFGIGVSTIAGVLTGILPALQASSVSPQRAIVRDGRSSVKGGRGLPGQTLVGAEIALSVVLVACAALLVQSFRSVLAQPLGYVTDKVVSAEIVLDQPSYREQVTKERYWRELMTALRADPMTEKAALVNWAPLSPGGMGFVEADTVVSGTGGGAAYRAVGDGYFETLGIPLLQGRAITERDDATQGRVVVIGKAVADHYWPGSNPIGRRLRAVSMEQWYHQGEAPWLTVVGVVGDIRHYGYEGEVNPAMYVSMYQVPERLASMTAVVRGRGDAERVREGVRRITRQLDPRVAATVTSLEREARNRIVTRTASMNVLLVFAGVALGLAAIGVFGVLSFSVAQRRRELAVRAAIGATPRSLVALVVGQAARVVAIGLAIGIAGVFAFSGVIRATLFDVVATDTFTLLMAVVIIASVALAAAFVPALRASRIDVREALVEE